MKDQPTSRRIGDTQRSRVLSITALAVVLVVVLLGVVVYVSRNLKQTQVNPVATQAASNTPSVAWSPGIYMVTHKNYSTSQISKADAHTHKVLWEFAVNNLSASSGRLFTATLTVSNTTVYYSTYDQQMSQNAVFALDANKGTLRWKTILAGRTDQAGYLSQPLYADGLLYVIEESRGTVTALDATTGEVRWTYDNVGVVAAGTTNGQLAVSKNTVYGIIANRLLMVSADTGKEIRSALQIDPDRTFVQLAIVDDVLYATSCLTGGLTGGKADCDIYAFDANQGTQRWLYHSATYIYQSIFSEEKVYFLTVDRSPSDSAGQGKMTLSALNAKGRAIWHRDVILDGIDTLVVGNGLLYLGYDVYDLPKNKLTYYLRAFQSVNGADAWIKQVDDANPTPNQVQNGILYAGLAPCQIGAFNAQNGKVLWHRQYCVPLDERDHSTPDFVVVP